MARHRHTSQQVGITPENKKVVNGVFDIFATQGLPLDVVFDLLAQRNCIPSWTHFYDDAIKQGWKHETIVNRLRDNISDVWGKEFSDNVLERIDLYSKTLYIEEMNK